jgi:hypothetical protein
MTPIPGACVAAGHSAAGLLKKRRYLNSIQSEMQSPGAKLFPPILLVSANFAGWDSDR